MGMKAEEALGASIKYVKESMSGAGAVAGAPCTIKSINKVNKTNTVTFEWTKTDGTKTTSTMTVVDGADPNEIASASINASNHLVLTMADTTTIDCGVMPLEPVKVSAESGNAVSMKADGLYVSTTGVEVSAQTGNTLVTKADGLYVPATDISGKVDKVTGKGLSTNDYDNTEKAEVAKVAGKVDKAQGVANKDKFLKVGADGNVTLGEVPSGTDIVTAWETTPVDTKVPSEKLVKDNIDTISQELAKKVAIAQGEANKGKALIVGNDGNVTCGTVATDNLTIVDKTQAQYDVLTDAEKNDATKLYNITDADDLDLTNYAKQSDVDAINNNLDSLSSLVGDLSNVKIKGALINASTTAPSASITYKKCCLIIAGRASFDRKAMYFIDELDGVTNFFENTYFSVTTNNKVATITTAAGQSTSVLLLAL